MLRNYHCNWVIHGYIPQVIVCGSLGNQVVNVHIAGLSNTVHSVLRLNQNLQENKKQHFSFLSITKCFLGPFVGSSSHPGVPEQLSEDHQVSSMQGETHVSRGDGQHSHAGLARELELLTQLLPLSRRSGAVNTDVGDVLEEKLERPRWV